MGLFKPGRFLSFPSLFAAVFGLAFGASAFLNVQQHARAQQDAKLMQGTITDLRYQVDQDHKQLAGNTSPSPSPSPSPSDSPLATPDPSPSASPAGQVAGASTASSATMIKACNLHASASTSSAIRVSYTSLKIPMSVSLNGGQAGIWQSITVNGKSGFVQATCLKY